MACHERAPLARVEWTWKQSIRTECEQPHSAPSQSSGCYEGHTSPRIESGLPHEAPAKRGEVWTRLRSNRKKGRGRERCKSHPGKKQPQLPEVTPHMSLPGHSSRVQTPTPTATSVPVLFRGLPTRENSSPIQAKRSLWVSGGQAVDRGSST